LRQVVSSPDFSEKAFERKRKQILVGIQQKQQSPGAIARDAFHAAVYGKHPYAFPNEGSVETMQSLELSDVRSFYQSHYVARNAIVIIVGDINKHHAKKLVESLTESLKVGEKVPSIPEVSTLAAAEQININHPSKQMHVLLGQPGVKRGDPDYFPLYVGNHILGGSGLVSQLFKEVREKRALSYSAYSYFSPRREKGPFLAGLQTKADQAEKALTVLQKTIETFTEQGPTEAELEAAKKNITGGFPLRLDSNSKILGYIGMIGFYGLPLGYLETFNDRVGAVTVEQIKSAFQRRLQTDKFITVMVGPIADEMQETAN